MCTESCLSTLPEVKDSVRESASLAVLQSEGEREVILRRWRGLYFHTVLETESERSVSREAETERARGVRSSDASVNVLEDARLLFNKRCKLRE